MKVALKKHNELADLKMRSRVDVIEHAFLILK